LGKNRMVRQKMRLWFGLIMLFVRIGGQPADKHHAANWSDDAKETKSFYFQDIKCKLDAQNPGREEVRDQFCTQKPEPDEMCRKVATNWR
jgi:hypothetical protein